MRCAWCGELEDLKYLESVGHCHRCENLESLRLMEEKSRQVALRRKT